MNKHRWSQKSMAAFLVGGLAVMGGAAVLSFDVISSPSSQAVTRSAAPAPHRDRSLGAMDDVSSVGSVPSLTPVTVPAVVAPKKAVAKAKTAPHGVAPKKAVVKARTSTVLPSITYTVKPGDTLFVIAEWFQAHGYGAIYNANKAVIGANPNLIFPGQHITIAGGSLSMGA
jgi:nucleoid-associated protein YgaU